MIDHILFDLGKVLTPFDWEIALARLRPHLPSSMARLLEEDRQEFQKLFIGPLLRLETGKMEFEEFYATISDILRIDLDLESFRRIWCDIFWMNEETVAMGESLSKQYGTWLVSNTSRVHYEWILNKFPRVAFYNEAALSYQLGYMKPAPQYYEGAIRKFAIDPSRAVFIDDIEDNVEGALKARMKGILFRGYHELVRSLEQLGVEVPSALKGEQ